MPLITERQFFFLYHRLHIAIHSNFHTCCHEAGTVLSEVEKSQFDSQKGQDAFVCSKESRPALTPVQPSIQWDIRRHGLKDYHLPPPRAKGNIQPPYTPVRYSQEQPTFKEYEII